MTREEAAASVEQVVRNGQHIDATSSRETREGGYFPYRVEGEVLLGSNGVIVNKRTGACFVLGSAFSVERDLAAYDGGFQFDRYDLAITAIRDREGTLDAIENIGPTIVEPEFAHGVVWQIPRALTRNEVGARVSDVPYTFTDIRLYFRLEVLQQVRRDGTFSFQIREHQP